MTQPGVADPVPPPASAAAAVRTVVALLLLAAWFAWPVLGYVALITVAPFFGELPTEADQAQATRLVVLGACVGLLAPVVAYALARGSTAIRVVAVVQVVVTLVAVALFLASALR